jgi:hypothetical protein
MISTVASYTEFIVLWLQEEYLSECHYEERVDEEGIRNILSLGEDYR